MSTQELLTQAELGTPSFYKTALPVPYVLQEGGYGGLAPRGKGLSCLCPLHEDSDPSFDTWQEPAGDWRWNCPPCGKGGDVLDLLQEINGSTFAAALAEAEQLYREMPQVWQPPVTAAPARVWDGERESRTVQAAQVEDQSPLFAFCSAKGLDLDVPALADTWRLGCTAGGEIVIPYYNRAGALVAYKHRTADTPALAAPGSSLRAVLYGEWRDTEPEKPVLLCEGESDCWAANAHPAFAGYAVLGLPGAGFPPRTEGLEGRSVLLAFDGDEAGRKATARWAGALLSAGCTVEFLPVPDGEDLRTVQDLAVLAQRTRSLKPSPETIAERGDVYVRPSTGRGNSVDEMLTNWRLEPELELVDENGMTAYEGTLLPTGRRVVLTSGDLGTKARIVSWCSRYGVAWLGADRDAQALLALLQAKGPYLPAGEMVSVAGLHGTAFVWPGGRAGKSSLVYSAPQYDVHLESRLALPDAAFTPLQVRSLRGLHRRDVMDPILGWLAAAPLRSLLPSFPTLAVTGSSGSGKTTLLHTVLTAFAGADITTNLTSTTKHALASFMACTNAFPVWFDEYRPGARKDTQLALEQLLRDAYTGQISAKGGLGEHWSEISAMRTDAPVVVSGEDTFTETSHTERMVNLFLPSEGKQPAALADVRAWGHTGLPLAYLNWLAKQLAKDALFLTPAPYTTGTAGSMPVRQQDNLGTVAWGFDLLDRFVQEHGAPPLGAPDLSLVLQAGAEAAQHNPIKDALLWALDEPLNCSGFVTADTENVYVRVTSFVTHIERQGAFQLPGRSAAVTRYLKDTYKAQDGSYPFYGTPAACLVLRRTNLC